MGRPEQGSQQIWSMLQEVNDGFTTFHPMAFFDDNNSKNLNQFYSENLPLFVHLSCYRTLKLTFPWDIRGLSLDGTIKSEIGHVSMAMFNADPQL